MLSHIYFVTVLRYLEKLLRHLCSVAWSIMPPFCEESLKNKLVQRVANIKRLFHVSQILRGLEKLCWIDTVAFMPLD